MRPLHDVNANLIKHFKIRLTDAEMKAMSMCLEAFFESCRMQGIKPPVAQTGLVLQALDKFSKALSAGPDIVTQKKLVATLS